MVTIQSASVLVVQDEWDGQIEDLITQEIGRDDLGYDLVTDLQQAQALLEDMSYRLIVTDPFLSKDKEDPEIQALPLIEFCGEKWSKTRILVVSSTRALEGDLLEQLDLPNVAGVYGKPLESEAVTEIAGHLEDL